MFDTIINTLLAGKALVLAEMNSNVVKKIDMKYFIIAL